MPASQSGGPVHHALPGHHSGHGHLTHQMHPLHHSYGHAASVPQQSMPPPPPGAVSSNGNHHPMPPPPGPQANGVPPQTAPSGRVVSGSSVDGGGPAGQQHSAAPVAGHVSDIPGAQPVGTIQKLAQANEQGWISIGSAAEAMEDYDRAIAAYESALRHNPYSIPAMSAIAGVYRTLDRFSKAVEYFQRVLNIVPENGETWGAMGHCYLMMDDLQKAYTAYQQALYHLPNPKEPKLWYGIGILYDRYGSLEHAEEAFASVVRMDPNYEKANEIYFRLGIIYKQQNKYPASLECFRYILTNPPRPLTEIDIWFQIGHVYEQQKDFVLAKEAYERVLAENPSHAKVLQQLGWLYHQSNAGFTNQDLAIQFLTKSLESDPNDSQSWYLLGRAYMAGQNYNKAYEAYQQAVYRDGKNPTFWCSIGVLYYQINQFRDALDAYSRAIRLNPYISEVWFDLGSLYESCNNQISDAIDAYSRAAELDPDNPHIKQRLVLLRNAEANGGQVPSAPMPQDVHPTAYANNPGMAPGPPSQIGGAPPPNAYPGGPAGPQLAAAGPRGDAPGGRDLPGPGGLPRAQSPANDPFRGAPPSIPNIDDRGTKGPAHTPLAPMDAPPASHLGPSGASRHEYSQGQSQFPRVNSPSPRHDPYGRGMASPRESPRARNMDAASQGGRSVSGQSMQQHPVDSYGRPLTSSRDREREMDWERSRAPGGSGRATPKEEPFHPSGGPSPVPQRATATRGERGDYFTSPYERNRPPQERDPRMSPLYHNAPPQEYERGSSNSASRYDPRNDRPADARPAKASRRPDVSTTNIDRERQRDEAGVRDELDGPGSEPVGTLSAQKQKGKRTGKMGKEDAESGRASPLGQRLEGPASSRKKKEPISRPESPLVSRASENNGSKNSRLDAKSAAGGKKGASKIKDDRQAPSPAASARAATPERPQHRPASVEQTPETSRTRDFSRAGRPQSPARSDTSTGSNRPLAARAPSRLVDEDYDGGAADALMGLAGAASLSTTNGNSELPRAAQEEPQANNQNKEMSEYPPAGAASDDASARGQESAETDAERLADQHRVANEEAEANRVGTPPTDVARQRAGSTLGKRPFEEDESHKDEDNATKRLRNGSSPRPVAEAGPSPPAARSPQGHTQEAPNHDREPSNHSRAVPQEEEQAPADGLPSPRPVPPSPQRSLPEPGELEESRPEEQQKAPSKSSEDREAPEAGEVKARVDEGDAPKMSMEKAAEQPNEEAKASGEAPETAAAAA